MSDKTPSEGPEVNLTYAQQLKLRREEHLAKYRANRLPTIEPPPTEPAKRLQHRQLREKDSSISNTEYSGMTHMEIVEQRRKEHLESFRQLHQKPPPSENLAERKRELMQSLERKTQERQKKKELLRCDSIKIIQNIASGEKSQILDSKINSVFKNLNLKNFQENQLDILLNNLPDFLQWIKNNQNQDINNFLYLIDKKRSDIRLEKEQQNFETRLIASIDVHFTALHRKRRQLLWKNDYGILKGMDKWIREITNFINEVVRPPQHMRLNYEYYAIEVNKLLDSRSSTTQTEPSIHNMTGSDFELHCVDILQNAGWAVFHNGKTGDQGVDLIAELNGFRVAIQCKRYAGSVGNAAVQEVFAGQKYESCDAAVVVSNAKFTTAAIQLARTLNVFLTDISELSQLNRIVHTTIPDSKS